MCCITGTPELPHQVPAVMLVAVPSMAQRWKRRVASPICCWFRPRAEVNVVAVFGVESGHNNATRPGDISLCVSPVRVRFSWPESRLTFETAFRSPERWPCAQNAKRERAKLLASCPNPHEQLGSLPAR